MRNKITRGIGALFFLITFAGAAAAQDPVSFRLKEPTAVVSKPGAKAPLWKKKKFWAGLVTSAVAVTLDQASSDAMYAKGYVEGTRVLRARDGRLRKGLQWAIWGGLNAALVPADMSRDDTFGWAAFAIRVGMAATNTRAAIRNWRLPARGGLTPRAGGLSFSFTLRK